MWQATCYKVCEQLATFSERGMSTYPLSQRQAYSKSGEGYRLFLRRLLVRCGFTVVQ